MSSVQSPGVKKNQSLGKALSILEKMVEFREPVKLKSLSDSLNLPAATVLRFLGTLMDCGYVQKNPDTGDYYLTLKLARLGEEVQSRFEIRTIARPVLSSLSREFNESVSLAVRQGNDVVYIDGVEGPGHTLRTLKKIGHRAPLHCTGVGKLLIMEDSPEALDTMFAQTGFTAPTEFSLSSREAVDAELQSIRNSGYALDNQECEYGVRCVAAPLRDYSGRVTASISMTAPLARMSDERIASILPRLLESASFLSRQMGFSS
ncbi:MAG: IclR family transcriptional regulator [Spirochaetales bacterium]|nr:IclR family transcriptional regulator [Spirochaetales bacterium]